MKMLILQDKIKILFYISLTLKKKKRIGLKKKVVINRTDNLIILNIMLIFPASLFTTYPGFKFIISLLLY